LKTPKRSRGKPRFEADVTRISFSVTTHPKTRDAMRQAALEKGMSVGKYLDRIFDLVVTGAKDADPDSVTDDEPA
jgi:hypothetical protein